MAAQEISLRDAPRPLHDITRTGMSPGPLQEHIQPEHHMASSHQGLIHRRRLGRGRAVLLRITGVHALRVALNTQAVLNIQALRVEQTGDIPLRDRASSQALAPAVMLVRGLQVPAAMAVPGQGALADTALVQLLHPRVKTVPPRAVSQQKRKAPSANAKKKSNSKSRSSSRKRPKLSLLPFLNPSI